MAITTTSDFIAKFHNLDGDLLGERKRSLFILLKTASQNLTPEELDVALNNLDPKTYQEKLFRIETLVYFKKIPALIEVLKDCNRDHIKIVMRQKWFMKEAFENVTPAELVNKFFPCVSYSTRLKLLWRIPNYWSEEKNDDLFDCVQKRYGLSIALVIVHMCSTRKIENLLKQQETILATPQIIYFVFKKEELLSTYLDCYNNRFKKPYADKNVLNMIAIKSPNAFLEFLKGNKIKPEKLTTAASIQLINIAKKELISDPQRFINFLNVKTLVKTLGVDFKTLFKNIFPRKINEFNLNPSMCQLIKLFPKSARWRLFTETYSNFFPNNTLEECLKRIDSAILTFNPPKEIVYKWAEIKYKTTGDDNFLKYYYASVSVPLLKEKINVTSDMKARQDLLKLLITSCAENKDVIMLDTVLEYIGSRHRNEDPYLYKRLIDLLLESFKENELSKNQWNFVYKQILLLKTEGSVRSVHFYDYKEIMVKYLEYSYQNDQDRYKTCVTDFLKTGCDSYALNFMEYLENSKYMREIFLDLCKLFPTVIPNDHQRMRETSHLLITGFIAICIKNPDQCVNILDYEHFVTTIEAICNKTTFDVNDINVVQSSILYSLNFPQYALSFLNESKILELLKLLDSWNVSKEIILPIIEKETMSDLKSRILRFALENIELDAWYTKEIMRKLFLNFPKMVSRLAIERTWFNIEIKDVDKLFINCSPEFVKYLCEHLINNWLDFDADKQEKAVRVLLNLLPADEFLQFVDLHLSTIKPTDELDTADDIDLHTVQSKLVGFLKDVVRPHEYIPLLLKFCRGDFLQFALTSLYSLCARYPEKSLYSHIETISRQNLPLQKYGTLLSCEFVDHGYVINILKNSNPSTHSLCSAILKYFAKTNFSDVFLVSINLISMIVTLNEKVFSTLTKVYIPKKYINQYIEVCCKMFANIEGEENKINKYVDKLLAKTFDKEIIRSLSSSNINNLIVRHFPQEGTGRLTNINAFVLYCLAYRHSERQINYELIFGILLKLNKKTINVFCNNFIDLQQAIDDETFVSDFVQQWRNRFSLTDSLEEHIILNLLLDRVNKPKETYSKNIVNYLEKLLIELDPRVFEIFLKSFKEQIDKLDEQNKLQLFLLMLNYKPTPTICVLILQLLEQEFNEENIEANTIFKDIIGIIEKIEIPIVKCYREMFVN